MVFVFSVFSFVLFSAIPIPELIQCYHLTLHWSLDWTADHSARCWFFLGGLFGLLVFCVVFVAFGVVWLFAVFLNGS